MAYFVKEVFHTLQGEGAQSGRSAVFLRFTGCNLWSGLEKDRATAICRFCDTDFVGGTKFESADKLADLVADVWMGSQRPMVVCTGGEPLLQLDDAAVKALHERGFEVAVETNGTLAPPTGLDWVCVSPKANTELAITSGDELKLVYPQPGAGPERFESMGFRHFFLQPMDGPDVKSNTDMAAEYCRRNPQWRLSVQMHKLIGLR